MDKDHLIELISNSLEYESQNSDSTRNLSDFKNYLKSDIELVVVIVCMINYLNVLCYFPLYVLPFYKAAFYTNCLLTG